MRKRIKTVKIVGSSVKERIGKRVPAMIRVESPLFNAINRTIDEKNLKKLKLT